MTIPTPPETRPEARRIQLACFGLGGQHFGIPVHRVRQIVRAATLTPLPAAPALIEGILDLHGVVLPVADLGRVLGIGPVADPAAARIAVVEAGDLVFGLRLETAEDVLTVCATDLEPPPDLATRAGYDLLDAVVNRPGSRPVLVVALDALLERIAASKPDASGEEAP